MAELAVIIPYAGEYPHLHYTLQSLITELDGYVDYEVIAIDNLMSQPRRNNNSESHKHAFNRLRADTFYPCLKFAAHHGSLSHWQAKNHAVNLTDAYFLFFLDAHCLVHPGSLRSLFFHYRDSHERLNGSIHLPIADFFSVSPWKTYRLIYNPDLGLIHYENQRIPIDKTTQVPCMSTCGMMCLRTHIVDDIEYWPELGPYGGGENYYNFVMARLGRNVWISPQPPIRHWHIPGVWSRDYRPTYRQWNLNRALATWLSADDAWAFRYIESQTEVSPVELRAVFTATSRVASWAERKRRLDAKYIMTIEDWAEKWTS